MIHNKYFEIVKQFLGDYSREIYGREMIGKAELSQKGIALALEELEKKFILKSRRQGTLKYYRLNLDYSEIKDILAVAEFIKKIEFFTKQRKIAHLFREDNRIVGVFGSYAKGSQKQSSDLDIFIIGKTKKKDYNMRGSALDLSISIKYFSKAEWAKLCKQKNNLCKEIINNHTIIFGVEIFMDLLWRHYYGFN